MIHPLDLTHEQRVTILHYFQQHDAVVSPDPEHLPPYGPNDDISNHNPIIHCQNTECEVVTGYQHAKKNWIRLFGDIYVGELYYSHSESCHAKAIVELEGVF